jgi:hypothetical protein
MQAQPPHRTRKALAVLSCIGRTIAAVKSECGDEVCDEYLALLLADSHFQLLPLDKDRVSKFGSSVKALESTGNLRRDLHAVGIPWAGVKQWKEFEQVLEGVRTRSLN